MKFLYVVIILISLFSFQSCTTIQIPDQVCTYGTMVCETGTYICENYEIPEPICMYFNIACVSLNTLCELQPDTPEYDIALENLKVANNELQLYLDNIASQPKQKK